MTRVRFLMIAFGGAVLESCGRKRSQVSQVPAAPMAQPNTQAPEAAPQQTAQTALTPPAVRHRRPPPALPSDTAPEAGVASWYGHPYHGRQSASGEIYDMEQMTAAHRTLPFNTLVHVDNLDNGMSTDVRINDRGPFVDNRVIDLSHAAASAINMVGPGTAHVRLTIVAPPAVPEPAIFAVQTAAFENRDNADRMQAHMAELYGAATLRLRSGATPLWRVLVGQASDPNLAEDLARRIRDDQKVPEAFVVRLDPVLSNLSNPPRPSDIP